MEVKTIVEAIRKIFGTDKRFGKCLQSDPTVKASYKDGKLVVDQLSWTCDGGWGALVVTKDKVRYDQERKTTTVLEYENWGPFNLPDDTTLYCLLEYEYADCVLSAAVQHFSCLFDAQAALANAYNHARKAWHVPDDPKDYDEENYVVDEDLSLVIHDGSDEIHWMIVPVN